MLQQGLRGTSSSSLAPRNNFTCPTPRIPHQRSRCCQVVQVSDAQTQQQQVASAPPITWGKSMAQGPRPTMEDELRLEENCKDGFTFAGDLPAWLSC